MMELKKAQKELAMLSETVLGGTARLSVDDEFRIITATDGYYRMTGYTEAESQSPPLLRQRNESRRASGPPDRHGSAAEASCNE